jgi:hypothetical protein
MRNVWKGTLLINVVIMMLICQPKLTKDVALCFVLRANRALVSILHNNGLRHTALAHRRAHGDVSHYYMKCQPEIDCLSRKTGQLSLFSVRTLRTDKIE